MKYLALLFTLCATPAIAQAPPLPPPWSCEVEAACGGENLCIGVSGTLPLHFSLSRDVRDTSTFDLKGADGYQRTAIEVSNLQAASQFAENYHSDGAEPFILVRNGKIMDTNSLWLLSMVQRFNGQHFVKEEMLLVPCVHAH